MEVTLINLYGFYYSVKMQEKLIQSCSKYTSKLNAKL